MRDTMRSKRPAATSRHSPSGSAETGFNRFFPDIPQTVVDAFSSGVLVDDQTFVTIDEPDATSSEEYADRYAPVEDPLKAVDPLRGSGEGLNINETTNWDRHVVATQAENQDEEDDQWQIFFPKPYGALLQSDARSARVQ